MNFSTVYDAKRKLVNNELEKYFLRRYPEIIYEAMYYSIAAGGKRIRPVLLLSVCEMLGAEPEAALPFACAVEMIHTSSLIHDDLPALDNDSLRRGKPTSHVMFGENIAILAGDCLLNLAYETMSSACEKNPRLETVRAMSEIAEASGAAGLLGGQVSDIINENKKIDEQTLLYIIRNKTAKLIKASAVAGGILSGAPESDLSKLREAGMLLGTAFQILDDMLDITGDAAKLGKNTKSDAKNDKQSYVTVMGIEKAKQDYTTLSDEALSLFSSFDNSGDFIVPFVEFITKRDF